jgi:transcriptional regulator with XRE-family HTH domain
MTQDVLAQRAGITTGYLSKIETAKQTPPLSTVEKIAKALGVGLDVLFSEEENKVEYSLIRAAEGQKLARTGPPLVGRNYTLQPLTLDYPNRHMEAYILSMPADAEVDHRTVYSVPGEQLLYALEGTGVVILGDQMIKMEPGDAIYFDSSIPHSGFPIGGQGSKFIAVRYLPEPIAGDS